MARTHQALTDPQLRKLQPSSTPIDIRDGETRGLILTVLPSGRKQFNVRYRIHGKQRRLVLGEYPGLSLAQARKRARTAQTAIDGGRDLAAEQQAAKVARTDTFAALVTDYLVEHARPHKRTADEDERALDADVLPHWRDRSVREITRADVKALLRGIVKRGSPIMANRVLALVRRVLNFAVDEEWIDANPAARVKKPGTEKTRDRVLTDEEVRKLWRILSHFPTTEEKPAPGRKRAIRNDDPLCPISTALAVLLKVRLLTAQRGGEVAKMRWTDVNVDTGMWIIPGSDTKNGEAHRVPLSAMAVELIQTLKPKDDEKADYVFTGRGGATVLDRARKAPGVIAKALDLNFRGHDLRRTAATRMAEAGIPREHISRVLNHVEGGPRATQIYNRYEYDKEKRIALDTWARTLTAILEPTDSSNVAPFVRGA